MNSSLQLLASDWDREKVARRLGTAMSEGRLTIAEYEHRLDRTYIARTYGELEQLTIDLPASPPPAPPRRTRISLTGQFILTLLATLAAGVGWTSAMVLRLLTSPLRWFTHAGREAAWLSLLLFAYANFVISIVLGVVIGSEWTAWYFLGSFILVMVASVFIPEFDDEY